jgi:nicotinate dehydrogenase subunit A
MLLAPRKPVKRRWTPKTPLPNKPAGCPASLFINRAAVSLLGGALARLYANGILGPPVQRDVCSTTIWPETTSMTQTAIRLTVNGSIHDVSAAPDTALLYVLRNDLELNGPKYGCGLGECGACAVLIDGVAARSCVIPISGCVGRDIVTLEGLGSRDHPDPVQDAFIREQAAQCGYCLNGMIMTTKALLMRTPHPSEADVLEALRYNLCRCGAHIEIVRAAMRAAGLVAEVQG